MNRLIISRVVERSGCLRRSSRQFSTISIGTQNLMNNNQPTSQESHHQQYRYMSYVGPKTYEQRGPGNGLSPEQIQTITSLVAERNTTDDDERANQILDQLLQDFNVNVDDRKGKFTHHTVGEWSLLTEEYLLNEADSSFVPDDDVQMKIGKLLGERILARKKNSYDLADKIRDELKKKYNVEIDDRKKEYSYNERAPSFLERTELRENTPGHALNALQKHAAKGSGNLIRQSDFIKLCNYARQGHLSDAKIIATALREFKCNNRFVLQLEGSDAAVNGMLRAMKPTWKVQDGRPDVRAALFILEQILDGENSGLYYTIERDQVDTLFDLLHNGLLEMQQNGFKIRIEEKEDGDEEEAISENEVAELSEEEKLSKDALRLTEGVFKLLIKRRSRPEWDMKKRAKRKYLKRLQVGGGPSQHTLCLATQISILVSGSAVAQEKIVDPFGEAKKTANVDEATLKLLETARVEEQVAEEALAAEAAAVAAAEEVEEGDGGDDVDGEEDTSEESAVEEDGEAESVEEKKD